MKDHYRKSASPTIVGSKPLDNKIERKKRGGSADSHRLRRPKQKVEELGNEPRDKDAKKGP